MTRVRHNNKSHAEDFGVQRGFAARWVGHHDI